MTAAEIFDRGYRRFDGERAGVGKAVRSVAWHTIRSILGLGRKGRHKYPIAKYSSVASHRTISSSDTKTNRTRSQGVLRMPARRRVVDTV